MSAPPDLTYPSGSRIGGRYLLEERIGAGAMGAVWRGTDELLNRTVAVKELLVAVPPGANTGDALEEARQRILREGRIGARLQHPHVISMFDVVVHDDRPWLVMEYLPSRSLATVLTEDGPLQGREAAEVGRQVADGLAAAHRAGVVHRDVKPGNVLLAADGRVKLTDFGVSRAVDDVQITRTGLIAGTPAFLAPEVARGHEPAPAADVFALGATLYAAVEGHPPFGLDVNAYALLHKVATGEVDPPRQAGPLTGVIMRLLAVEPGDRPSAAQARDALAAVAAGAPASLDPAPGATAVFDGLGAVGRRPTPPPPRRAPAAGPVGPAGPTGSTGPVTMTAPPVRPAPRLRRRPAPTLLVLLGVLLFGAVAAGAVALTGRSVPDVPPSAAAGPTETAPSATRPRSSPAPSPAPSPEPAPVVADPVGFVRGYYALLPEQTGDAFALLSPRAQDKSGGRDTYDRFWSNYEGVAVQEPSVQGNVVTATIVFDPKDGPDDSDRYRLVVGADDDGGPIIQDFDRLG